MKTCEGRSALHSKAGGIVPQPVQKALAEKREKLFVFFRARVLGRDLDITTTEVIAFGKHGFF
jgi:hypothetical protein